MRRIIIVTLVLSVISLFLEQTAGLTPLLRLLTQVIDFTILALIILEIILDIREAPIKSRFLRENLFSVGFITVYLILFIINKSQTLPTELTGIAAGRAAGANAQAAFSAASSAGSTSILVIRNLFLIFKVFGRLRRLTSFLRDITTHPAQTILISFVLVILAGTLGLMMPFATTDGNGLSLLDSLFTSTSAVCVTGLIVVDTATAFTTWGHIFILVLIQIGGLSFMMLSYFTIVLFRQKMRVEDRFVLSYMLEERNMQTITENLKRIVLFTFGFELAGVLILLPGFLKEAPERIVELAGGSTEVLHPLFLSLFHSISAFCNAGFALFSDSFEGFRSNPFINTGIMLMIVFGGLSFVVFLNLQGRLRFLSKLRQFRRKLRRIGPVGTTSESKPEPVKISLNTKIVLIITGILIFAGTFLFYGLEHGRSMTSFSLGDQYLTSLFQSITLRTAGFNTIGIGGLHRTTYLIMMIFMFIGAASGSTAGGIKINSLAVIGARIRSSLRNQEQTILAGTKINEALIHKAFLILVFGISLVGLGTIILSATESMPLVELMFESVSAFGTVGLSTGVTPSLSPAGKIVIIFLMFLGRLGPLTVLAAFGRPAKIRNVTYPQAQISLG
ncbi:MAG: TrkH family potassium uptake protein [Spirochaetales bacterium]|nr:TrkH family potassium uptake protein [Spirochaetales bacterium]MCF7937972.1 TrkH family potassium uptake protein [Spirochaetales bacterium]